MTIEFWVGFLVGGLAALGGVLVAIGMCSSERQDGGPPPESDDPPDLYSRPGTHLYK